MQLDVLNDADADAMMLILRHFINSSHPSSYTFSASFTDVRTPIMFNPLDHLNSSIVFVLTLCLGLSDHQVLYHASKRQLITYFSTIISSNHMHVQTALIVHLFLHMAHTKMIMMPIKM